MTEEYVLQLIEAYSAVSQEALVSHHDVGKPRNTLKLHVIVPRSMDSASKRMPSRSDHLKPTATFRAHVIVYARFRLVCIKTSCNCSDVYSS